MVKEVNPRIHVNERDYPVDGHHCSDPEKAKLVKKLALLITDNIPRKLPGGMKENHMDFWILDQLLTKDEVRFMLSFKKRRVGLTTKEIAARTTMSADEAQKKIQDMVDRGDVCVWTDGFEATDDCEVKTSGEEKNDGSLEFYE